MGGVLVREEGGFLVREEGGILGEEGGGGGRGASLYSSLASACFIAEPRGRCRKKT